MEVEIITEKKNKLLKRSEIEFSVDHSKNGATPSRVEVRKVLANKLKKDMDLVFINKFETKAGTKLALGKANIYDLIEQAKSIEPNYIVKRNNPTKKIEQGEQKSV